jgi:putative endonuclease
MTHRHNSQAIVQGNETAVGTTNGHALECFVYVLGSSGRNIYWTYVGWAIDLDRRLAEHNAGKGARSTRGRSWILLYAERYATRRQAMSREWHLKRDRRFRKLLSQS